MSNAFTQYDIADLSSDPLYILLAREDEDGFDEEPLESIYLSGLARTRQETERRIDGRDMMGCSPFEQAEHDMGVHAE